LNGEITCLLLIPICEEDVIFFQYKVIDPLISLKNTVFREPINLYVLFAFNVKIPVIKFKLISVPNKTLCVLNKTT
jgi:hypothetical protein